MALEPIDPAHALQIQAGTIGRRAGHTFEDSIASRINALTLPRDLPPCGPGHIHKGDPAELLVRYLASRTGITELVAATAISTGALATSEAGKQWLSINAADVYRCKSDLVVTLSSQKSTQSTVGVSIKQCNNVTPTNAQLFFTTARGFTSLLRANGIPVSDASLKAMRQFCGDPDFRPIDDPQRLRARRTDPRRWFWEEIDGAGRKEWEAILSNHQDVITTLLLTKAYLDDPFIPEYLLHKTRRSQSWAQTEVAVYSVEELVRLSRQYQGFGTKAYSVRKGSHKDPPGVSHLAPRFGIIQMQRGGQKQHPEQLQFNLEAGYFYKLQELSLDVSS